MSDVAGGTDLQVIQVKLVTDSRNERSGRVLYQPLDHSSRAVNCVLHSLRTLTIAKSR